MIYRLSLYIFPTILILYVVRKYRERQWGKCTNKVKLDGKVALVTGANTGIGYEVAKELAARGAQVILACRSLEQATLAGDKIRISFPHNITLVPMEIDLASLKSIKTFCQLVKKDYSQIDILVNNAGVAYPRSQRLQTTDGFEIHFGVNHLGHFYMTQLLEGLLAKGKGRIVVVASALHEKGRLDLKAIKNLDFESNEYLYANSKLANVYFVQELARRVKAKGIKVYGVCPGWAYTGLLRHTFKWYYAIVIAPVAFFYMRTAKQSSETVIYCTTEPCLENETGLLYKNCSVYPNRTIFSDKLALELWQESECMVDSIIKTD